MWWTLFAMCFALFMIMLDNTVVNVALPSIQHELDATPSTLEWTVNAYVLTFATLILLGGKLGDRFGRQRLFLVGLIVFTVASALCALSDIRHPADRRPHAPGRRRRDHEPALAVHPRRRRSRASGSPRRSASGPASPASASRSARCSAASWSSTSAGRASSGSTSRSASSRGRRAALAGRRVARPAGQHARHRRHRAGDRRPVRPRLRPDPDEQPLVAVAGDPRPARRRGRAARRLRGVGDAHAGADAAARLLQVPRVLRRGARGRPRRPRPLRLDLLHHPVLPEHPGLLARWRPASARCRRR